MCEPEIYVSQTTQPSMVVMGNSIANDQLRVSPGSSRKKQTNVNQNLFIYFILRIILWLGRQDRMI